LPKKMQKALLIILDGWGIGPIPEADAIRRANTPFFDSLMRDYPNARLVTYGEAVGLPEGQMGNSEVGHLNIGAGRIVYQELTRINRAIADGSLAKNPVLLDAIHYAKENHKRIHFVGLVSDGGIHSHIHHLKALIEIAGQQGATDNAVHVITDGRDTDPHSGVDFVRDLMGFLKGRSTRIASVIGRFYAMDRDKRWERIKKAYDLYVSGQGKAYTDPVHAVRDSYAAGVTDEFIEPIVVTTETGAPVATLNEGDVVIAFNFRTDRLRELTTVLTQRDLPEHGMHTLPLYYVTMTRYDDSFRGIHVLFEKEHLKRTLGEYVSSLGLTQLRTAETEKYAHVTFFFSGGREESFPGEQRALIPSPKVRTYDLLPEMSAPEVTDSTIRFIETKEPDLIVLNYANADMVGHTGVFQAAMKAAETVDRQLRRLVHVALQHGYRIVIIADHGNSDYMINEDGTPNTAHTKSPVPIIIIKPDDKDYAVQDGKLADVAPTLLHLMELPVPEEMTGHVLVSATKPVKPLG